MTSAEDPFRRSAISRRRLLQGSAATAGLAVVGGLLADCGGSSTSAPTASSGGGSAGATPQSGAGSSSGTPKKGGTLIVGMEAEISSFDPAVATGTSTGRPLSDLFDPLTNTFGQQAQVQPDLAESWNVSDDGLTVTVKLRPNVKFHDGTDVNADAVVFTFERMLNTKSPNYFGPYAFPSFDYPAYKTSSVVDPLTAKFELSQPDATFISSLTWITGALVSPTAAKAAGKDFTSKPVGTGPFKFVSWEKNVKTTMARFDGHWRGAPNFDQVIWKPIIEEAARFNQLASGEVDFIVSLDPQFVPQVQSNPNLQLIQGPSLHTWWATLNVNEPHLKDVRVRQALNYAINKDSLIQNVLKGTAVVSKGWAWPNTWSYEPSTTAYPYDPNKAKQLLTAAGYPNGFDLDYFVPESGSGMVAPKEIATAMQADLKKVGVNVNITTMEWISYIAAILNPKGLDNINGKQIGMAQLSWMNPVDDPGMYVQYCTAGQGDQLGANIGSYNNPQYNDLLAKARTTNDQAQRATLYKQAQKIFADDAPWIFMFHSNFVTAARKNIMGIVLNPNQNVMILKDAWKA